MSSWRPTSWSKALSLDPLLPLATQGNYRGEYHQALQALDLQEVPAFYDILGPQIEGVWVELDQGDFFLEADTNDSLLWMTLPLLIARRALALLWYRGEYACAGMLEDCLRLVETHVVQGLEQVDEGRAQNAYGEPIGTPMPSKAELDTFEEASMSWRVLVPRGTWRAMADAYHTNSDLAFRNVVASITAGHREGPGRLAIEVLEMLARILARRSVWWPHILQWAGGITVWSMNHWYANGSPPPALRLARQVIHRTMVWRRSMASRVLLPSLKEAVCSYFPSSPAPEQVCLWCDAAPRRLARQIIRSGDLDECPILADALEEAGWEHPAGLAYLRQKGPCSCFDGHLLAVAGWRGDRPLLGR